jgi:GT2 family glycosyltransferase
MAAEAHEPLRASVVVPVRDGAARLRALLDALDAQTFARERFEVVVAANGSRDDSAAVARAAGASVVELPRPNRAAARNAGAAAARSERIAFLDADCVPESGWLEALIAGLDEAELAGGAVKLEAGSPPNGWERLDLLWRFDQERNVAQGWSVSANLAIRRAAFETLGGFDPGYRHVGEDVDLCVRARECGFRLAYVPGAVVRHEAERTARPALRRGFVQGYASNQHHHRFGGLPGWRHWRHPRPALAGDWALRRWADPTALPAGERRALLWRARLEYGARVLGSGWAELRRAR